MLRISYEGYVCKIYGNRIVSKTIVIINNVPGISSDRYVCNLQGGCIFIRGYCEFMQCARNFIQGVCMQFTRGVYFHLRPLCIHAICSEFRPRGMYAIYKGGVFSSEVIVHSYNVLGISSEGYVYNLQSLLYKENFHKRMLNVRVR